MEEDKEEHLEDLSLSDSESVMTGNIPYDSEESSSKDDNSKSDLGSIQRRSKFGWPRTSHSKRKDIESQTNKSGRESFQENQPTNQTDDSDEQEKRRIKPTRERRIITCLTLALCSICLLATLGIGILIGIATSKESGKNPTANESLTSEPSPSPTINQPTRSPTTDDLLGLLISKSFDEGASILTSGTPQRAAYEWLLQNSNLDGYSDGVKIARYALATLFYSTNGLSTWDEQIREGGWITDAPECEWASTATNQCTDGVYTSLTLDFVGVSGQIPQELGLLTGLKRLSLRSEGLGSPSVSGTLPDSIGELVDLETIRLNGNNIGGTLPSTVGQLTNIRVFLLSGNSLIGTIPSEIGNTGGNTYNFDGNQLSGKIPIELLTMQTLRSLNFDGNKLSGSIPTEIALNPSLNSLSLSGNKLVGRIPSEIGNLVTINGKSLLKIQFNHFIHLANFCVTFLLILQPVLIFQTTR